MTDNFREYQTIKFFRGKKRKDAELVRFAETKQDLEFRRLFIEESELDLHVYYSRMTIYNWLSWNFLALAIYYSKYPVITYAVFGLAVISHILSLISKKKFEFVFRRYNFALSIIESLIYNEYGISL
jgi:hypothetical protein